MSPVAAAVRNQRTALYRLFDAADDLLYVGITTDPERRWSQHGSDKPWWRLVARRTVEWHADRKAAEKAESGAVQAERPLYNSAGAERSMLGEHFPLPRTLSYAKALVRLSDVLDGTQHHSQHVEITRRGKRAGIIVPPEWYDRAVASLSETPAIAHPIGSPEWTAAKMTPAPEPESDEFTPEQLRTLADIARERATPEQLRRLERTGSTVKAVDKDQRICDEAYNMGLLKDADLYPKGR